VVICRGRVEVDAKVRKGHTSRRWRCWACGRDNSPQSRAVEPLRQGADGASLAREHATNIWNELLVFDTRTQITLIRLEDISIAHAFRQQSS